jgi:hypothetical protein
MKAHLLAAATVIMGLALPAEADPTVGIGLSFAFGGGKSESGIGLRVFSDNERDKAAVSAGMDYMFQSRNLRPTVGIAYLGRNVYIGTDMGFGLNGGGLDFGLSAGGVNTKKIAPPVPAVTPVVTPPAPSDCGPEEEFCEGR